MKRDESQKKKLNGRVARIAGQVAGVGRMIEEDRYCPDILHTISAIHAALRGLEATLLEDHVRHCVMESTGSKKAAKEKLEELLQLYRRRLS